MGIMDVIRRIGGKKDDEEYVPRQVVDRQLDSLRRQKQTQTNEDEKVELKKQIADYNRQRTATHLFGIKGKLKEAKKQSLIKAIKQKKVSILDNQNSMLSGGLDNKKQEFKKKEVDILNNHSSFLK